MSNDVQQTLRIRNGGSADIELHLEPWGDQFVLEPGASVDVIARGPGDGHLELESRDGRVVIYGWVGSVATVVQGSQEITSGQRVSG